MAAPKSPYVPVKCKCPVCQAPTLNRYIKTRLYMPKEVDSDHHVVQYQWESPEYEHLRPINYLVWYCPKCFFCDEMDSFRGQDNLATAKAYLVHRKFESITSQPNNIVKRMAPIIDLKTEEVPLEVALVRCLAAIYIQQQVGPENRHFAKLGRFQLRVAWLFRERSAARQAGTGDSTRAERLDGFLRGLREAWPDIPLSEPKALSLAFESYREALQRTNRGDDIRREIETMFLLADLLIRLERLPEAANYVRECHRIATVQRNEIQQALTKGVRDLSAQRIVNLQNLTNWLGLQLDRARELHVQLKERLSVAEEAAKDTADVEAG